MPELPEVQVVINYLNENVLNKKINDIKVNLKKLLKNTTLKNFIDSLLNTSIIQITRRGKYLLFEFKNNKCLVVHLRMEGKFFYEDTNYIIGPHDHLIFRFNDKTQLIYNDTRQFGTFHLFNSKNEATMSTIIKKLGPEPFASDFNQDYLFYLLSKSHKHIKTFLLDQTKVVGIGNIYADEILFASKINPLTITNHLTLKDANNIVLNAQKILTASIANNGTTIHTFKFNKWSIGDYQKYLKVHLQKAKPCPKCKTLINKIVVNGRGTYYCPSCQKEKNKC